MLQLNHLVARFELKTNPTLLETIQELWDLMEMTDEGHLSKETYFDLNVIIHKELVPGVSLADARETAEQDWHEDMDEKATCMEFDDFSNAMFEMADIWVDNVD